MVQYKFWFMQKSTLLVVTLTFILTTSLLAQKVGIGIPNPSNMLEVVSAVNAPSTATIHGTNNGVTGTAIAGVSHTANSIGVSGNSLNGNGVQGTTNNYIGVSAYSPSGTALNVTSNVGYALQVSGNLKFASGNTNPSQGAVLTSDATGNATWKKSNIAFLGVKTLGIAFADGEFKKVEFVDESYDLQNNFLGYNNGTTPATSSMFTAPVAGVYHFSSCIAFSSNNKPDYYFTYADIKLVKNSSSTVLAIYRGQRYVQTGDGNVIYLQVSGDFHLEANDKVWVEALQRNNGSSSEGLISTTPEYARFSGHLVVAD